MAVDVWGFVVGRKGTGWQQKSVKDEWKVVASVD